MALDLYHPGLRGVIAGETNISSLDNGLIYRGYCIHDLAEESNYQEVCYLLLHEELPTEEELADFRSIMLEEMELPEPVTAVLESLPLHVTPLEALRTGVSLLAHFDPQTSDGPLDSGHGQAVRLLARVPMLIAAWHRLRSGGPLPAPAMHLGYAGNFYYLITGKEPPVLFERAFDSALIAAAEHEFNPSTYAARMVGSTGGDLYAAVTAGLGVLAGSRHGGGDDRVLDIIQSVESPDRATEWAREACQSNSIIPGFGHPVYKDCDPRAALLETLCAELAGACGCEPMEEIADAIERAVWEERKLPVNIDWSLSRLLHYLGLPRELYVPIFAAARIAGWCAHVIEQADCDHVIRPRARYRGVEERPYVRIWDR
ncbi:MAG: citrate synthase [Planctomycetota bacterium]|nr:MAG: citrate synthase [Planctomycetota bacterium]